MILGYNKIRRIKFMKRPYDLFGPKYHGELCYVGQEVAIGRDADGFPIAARITDM